MFFSVTKSSISNFSNYTGGSDYWFMLNMTMGARTQLMGMVG